MRDETIRIDGLKQGAEIRVDSWGVPHLRAESLGDLFFVQGFNAARDRLWQIDLWRKRGLGLLAKDFGPGFLAQDYAARLFLYRGDMAAEWACYAPDAQDICERFVAGINAYVALCDREPDRLPPEFSAMGTKPAKWKAEDVVRIRTHGLTRNATSEILRAHVMARADLATDLLRKNLEPAVTPKPAGDIDWASIPLAAADLFKLASASVTFTPARLAATMDEAWEWSGATDLGEVTRRGATKPDMLADMQGSNNWAISPQKSATGRPILGSDPHRAHAVPSLRYLVHLAAPGFDAIGAGEPVLPGISFGHNGSTAFALTIFYPDQEDVYVYDTPQGEPDAYAWKGGVEAMRRVTERFEVKGAEARDLDMLFTRHGPVVLREPEKNRAYAIRSVWSEPGTCAYARSLTTMRAKSVAEFREGLKGWHTPSANHVAADIHGQIGWMPCGLTPLRKTFDGLTPAPGDGSCEWEGWIENEALPRWIDPPEGFVATANEMNLPPDYDHAAQPLGFEWVEGSRASRIREVLSAQDKHALADTMALQTDVASMPSRRLASIFARLAAEDGPAAPALNLLCGWNQRLEADSAGAALFEVWWTKHMKPALLTLLVPDAALRALLAPGDVETILQALEKPDARFGADPAAARDRLVVETLAAAFEDCAARMGANPSGWRWGRLHHGAFDHALSGIGSVGKGFDLGPWPMGGNASCPMHTGYRPSDFRTIAGASVRLAIDVGDWDRSMCVNAPGQSGDPRSPHYGDLAPLWSQGGYVPLLYTREAVDGATSFRILLEPSN